MIKLLKNNTAKLKKIEEELKKSPDIQLGYNKSSYNYRKISKLPLKEGILEIIKANNKIDTYYKNYYLVIQCERYKRRSLGDLFKIAQNYYPDIRIIGLKNVLNELLDEHQIKSLFCWDIQKRVYFRFYNYGNYDIMCRDGLLKDEYGLKLQKRIW